MRTRENLCLKVIKQIDPILFGATSFLTLLSILTIFGAMDNFGRSKLVMQVAMAFLGTVMMFIIANVDYKFFVDRFIIIMFVASAILLALTLIIGISGESTTTANKSWLRLWPGGPMIQPSEFVKNQPGFPSNLLLVTDPKFVPL